MKLILAEPFKSLWAGRDAFAEVERLDGQVYRELEARRTLRTEVAGHGFFVKIHRGIGWGEIFKNLLTPSCRCSAPARNGRPSSVCSRLECRP